MKRAGAHAAVANIGNRDNLFLLQASREQHSSHHRNHVAEMRDWTNEAFLHVAEVNVKVATTGWSPGLSHVLREDVAWPNPLHQHGAEISNQGRNEIPGLKCISTSDCRTFLAQRTKDAADHFGLAI